MFPGLRIFFTALLISVSLACGVAVADENLFYRTSYSGVFSLFKKLPIADVTFIRKNAGQTAADQSMQQLSLSISSKNYPIVEQLSPLRYAYQSFFSPQSRQTLLFENLKTTKKTNHKVGLFDIGAKKVQLFSGKQDKFLVTAETAEQTLALKDMGKMRKQLNIKPKAKPLSGLMDMPIDRLSLLEMIRQQVKNGTTVHEYFITSGDELMTYRVLFVKQEAIQLGDRLVDAQKVKVEAFDFGEEKQISDVAEYDYFVDVQNQSRRYRHAPVYIWVSMDEKHLPLKFENQHAIGKFVIQLIANEPVIASSS